MCSYAAQYCNYLAQNNCCAHRFYSTGCYNYCCIRCCFVTCIPRCAKRRLLSRKVLTPKTLDMRDDYSRSKTPQKSTSKPEEKVAEKMKPKSYAMDKPRNKSFERNTKKPMEAKDANKEMKSICMCCCDNRNMQQPLQKPDGQMAFGKFDVKSVAANDNGRCEMNQMMKQECCCQQNMATTQNGMKKDLAESCEEFLNVLHNTVADIVGKSVEAALHDFLCKTAEKMNALTNQMQCNEKAMAQSYNEIMEKMDCESKQTNKKFKCMLKFVMDNISSCNENKISAKDMKSCGGSSLSLPNCSPCNFDDCNNTTPQYYNAVPSKNNDKNASNWCECNSKTEMKCGEHADVFATAMCNCIRGHVNEPLNTKCPCFEQECSCCQPCQQQQMPFNQANKQYRSAGGCVDSQSNDTKVIECNKESTALQPNKAVDNEAATVNKPAKLKDASDLLKCLNLQKEWDEQNEQTELNSDMQKFIDQMGKAKSDITKLNGMF